jgi:hypothetical protein
MQITSTEIESAFSLIVPDAIGKGRNADGRPDGSDDWNHESAAFAREITASLEMKWDFCTWAEAKLLAIKSITD